jgi:hypothetical protein
MFRSLVCLTVLIFASTPAFAASISKVKGKSVLIDLKGDAAAAGESFYAVKADGKRSALIKIAKVKGDKAIGKILKGKAAAGMSLEPQPSKVTADRGGSRRSVGDSAPAGRSYWGGLFGYGRDSMDVNINNSITGAFQEKGSLSGSGFSAKGLFDYEIFSQVWFRFTAGLEMFKVSGPAKCGSGNAQPCDANINYLSMDFLGRYVFSNGTMRPWLGAGVGLLFPMSKEASALQAQSISTTNVIMFGGGVDWFTSPNFYIPISIEYGMLPKSDEVEASWIAFRVGFAVPF